MRHSWMEEILKGAVSVAVLSLYGAGDLSAEEMKTQNVSFDVEGMKNNGDAEKIRRGLKGMPGVVATRCDHVGGKCRVEIDPSRVRKEDVAVQVNRLGYQAFIAPR